MLYTNLDREILSTVYSITSLSSHMKAFIKVRILGVFLSQRLNF